MREGYKIGDKCCTCGRPVVKWRCPLCKGTGKPTGDWIGHVASCYPCDGRGYTLSCPVGTLLSLGDHFKGINCSHYNFEDVVVDGRKDNIITRKPEFVNL